MTSNSGLNPKTLFGNDTLNQSENSKLVDVIHGVMSTKDMSVRTVLEGKHIVAVTQGLVFAEQYNSTLMRLLVQTLMEVRVSLNGRGRTDLISALKSVIPAIDTGELEMKKRTSRWFG